MCFKVTLTILLIRIRNIDEDGKFISAAFLLNLPLMTKCEFIAEFIEKFNKKIRQILQEKYTGRNINVNFDNYKAIPKEYAKSTIMRYV
jgi:hypothetical protein